MTRTKHLAAMLLVAADLGWVLQTGALHPGAAATLALLVVAAPFCAQLARSTRWTHAWNAALGTAFVILVQRVVTGGTAGLLEGGVMLAMTCQVHLLHAETGRRRADLLTFNSILIALVAGQAGSGGGFAGWLALWASALVAFLVTEAAPEESPATHVLRRAAGAALTTGSLALGIGTAIPEGWLTHDALDAATLGWTGSTDLGTGERLDLRRFRPPADETAVAFRVAVRSGRREEVPTHWRTAVLEHQDGMRFVARHRLGSGVPLGIESTPTDRGRLERATAATQTRVAVTLVDHPSPVLPAPLELATVAVPLDGLPDLLHSTGDGILRRPCPRAMPRDARGYELGIGATAPAVNPGTNTDRAPYLRLDVEDPSAVPPVLHDLVRAALRGLADHASPMEIAARCRDHLAAGFSYARPDEQGAAADFESFLDSRGGGHCEYFATALVLMLRLRGVPCRIATGFLVHEWDPETTGYVVRARDAHAWVEVLDAGAGRWRTVDPTPSTVPASVAQGTHRGLLALAAAALVAAFGASRIRRTRGETEAARRYRRAVRRAGLTRAPHETPRELLARAEAEGRVRRDRLEALGRATEAHELHRFRASVEEPAC